MITHFVVLPMLLLVLLVVGIVRLVTSPFRSRRHRHWGQGWNGYGNNGYGCRRRGFGGGGLLTVLGLLALERLFGRRW